MTDRLPAPRCARTLLSLAIGAMPLAGFAADLSADALPATMPTVVVTAAGFEQAIREAPASITVLTREQLEKERFGNLAQAPWRAPPDIIAGNPIGMGCTAPHDQPPTRSLLNLNGNDSHYRLEWRRSAEFICF